MRGGSKALSNLQQLFWFDVGVGVKVGLEVGSLIETALTNGTSVRRFLKMKNFVNSQCPVLTETFSAILTFKWFLLGMDIAMVPESK